MLKGRFFRSKLLILGIVASVSLLVFPHEALGQAGPGSVTGFIYADDVKSPVAGAVVKLRNVLTGAIYQSEPSDKNGMYVIKGITAGSYVLGISTQKGDFNFDLELQIKAVELAKLNLLLKSDQKQVLAVAGAAAGTGFFATPLGIAVAVVAASAVTAATVTLLGPAETASPARR